MRGLKRLELCFGIGLVATSAWPEKTCAAEKTETPLRTTLEGERERQALGRALSGAIRRLQRPRCRRIFLDFEDPSGRSLQEGLDAVGQSGASFLSGWIVFADGDKAPGCDDPDVLAVTLQGSRSVWICGRRFAREQLWDPGNAEVVLIHETLHALGLGENPPSSAAISRQVAKRCGS